ncbi:uncharacterized protein LOC134834394 [Culicoides brevitarsis]|uniref:uncharacterized protein LOC134834394 n=1 Tax=Culicoides brevitarsis TaxID=469753 RepID=UPI00307C0698
MFRQIFFLVISWIILTYAQMDIQPNECGLDVRSNFGDECAEQFETPTTDSSVTEKLEIPVTTPSDSTVLPEKGRYRGCFKDSLVTRMFNRRLNFGLSTTIEHCVDFCATEGFVYAGLQHKMFCFCGNIFPQIAGFKQLGENKCFFSCLGNRNQKCGGILASSVYETGNQIVNHH